MNTRAILQSLDEEIARLEQAKTLLIAGKTKTRPVAAGQRKPMSAAGRASIAAAQRKRWAKTKRGK